MSIIEQQTDWLEHLGHVWEGIFLRAGKENKLDFDCDVDGWNVYPTETNAGQPPHLTFMAGPANFSFKGDPLAVANAYLQFGECLITLIEEAQAAGAFKPRAIEATEAIRIMQENRQLRKAK